MKYSFSLKTPVQIIKSILFFLVLTANIHLAFGIEYTMPLYPSVSDLLYTNKGNIVILKFNDGYCRNGDLDLYLSNDIHIDSFDYKFNVVPSSYNNNLYNQTFSFNVDESFTARDTVYYLIGIYASDCNTDTLSYGTFTRIVAVNEFIPSDILSSNIIAPDTIRNDTQIIIQTECERIRNNSGGWINDTSIVYLSTDTVLDASDSLLSKVYYYESVRRRYKIINHNISLNNLTLGNYYLIHQIGTGNIIDLDSSNNTSFKKINIVEPGTEYENIESDTLTDYNIEYCKPDETVIVKNYSSRCALGVYTRNVFLDSNVLVSIYLSEDAVFDTSDKKISDKVYTPDEINTTNEWIYFKIDSSANAGPAYLIVFVNSDTAIVESNYDNNFFVKKIIITEPMGKLVIYKYIAPKVILSTPLGLKISTYRTNIGKSYAGGIVHDLYLTNDSVLSPNDTLFATITGNKKCYIGQTNKLELYFNSPDFMNYGIYYLISHIYSSTNSEVIDTIIATKIERRNKSYDLSIGQEYSEGPGLSFRLMDGEELSYTIRNNGPDKPLNGLHERHDIDLNIYLSKDNVFDSTDKLISNSNPTFPSFSNKSYIRLKISVNFRNVQKGKYYLIAQVSSKYDTIEENNTRVDVIELLGSRQDFYVSYFNLNSGFFYKQGNTINFSTHLGVWNLNTYYWTHYSTISLSKDDAYSLDDIRLDGYNHIMGSDGAISHSSEVILPEDIADGIYYVGAIINAHNYFCEANEENNFSYWPIYVGDRQNNDVSIRLKNPPPVPIYYPGNNYIVEFNLQAKDTIFDIFNVSLNYKKLGSAENLNSLVDTIRWLSWGDTSISASLEFYLPSIVVTGYYEFELSCLAEVDSTDPDLSNNIATFIAHVGDFVDDISSFYSNKKDKQEIELYPNPSNGQFTLNMPDNNAVCSVSIFNQTGQLLYENDHFVGQHNSINIEDFPNGIYFVRIMQNTNDLSTIKLIKE